MTGCGGKSPFGKIGDNLGLNGEFGVVAPLASYFWKQHVSLLVANSSAEHQKIPCGASAVVTAEALTYFQTSVCCTWNYCLDGARVVPGSPARLQGSHLVGMIQGLGWQEEDEDDKNGPNIRKSPSLGRDKGSEEILWWQIDGVSLTWSCFNFPRKEGRRKLLPVETSITKTSALEEKIPVLTGHRTRWTPPQVSSVILVWISNLWCHFRGSPVNASWQGP